MGSVMVGCAKFAEKIFKRHARTKGSQTLGKQAAERARDANYKSKQTDPWDWDQLTHENEKPEGSTESQ